MIQRLIVWALCTLTAGFVSARQAADGSRMASATADTAGVGREMDYGMLEEITVTGSRIIERADRKLLLPDGEQARTATDGLDLLRKMQVPRIEVNPLTGEVGRTGGGKVLLCINGVQASSAELAAIRPEDIVRIEYHDAPGARYAGNDAVIDYITRRQETGGSMSADAFACIGEGKWASIDHLSLQHSKGRETWALVAGYMGQRRDNWVRDYEETWRYPDHEVMRREVGTPVRIGGDGLQGHLNYSLAEDGQWLFSARLGMDYGHIPAKEEGDRRTTLYVSDGSSSLDIYEHTTERSLSPSLDLYLQRQLGNGRQLILDVVGTYIHTSSHRIYQESRGEDVLAESLSDIGGDRYSVIAEGYYESTAGDGRLSAGLRHLQAYTENRYGGTMAAAVSMRQTESSAFIEYLYHHGAWSATGSLAAGYMRYGQGGGHTELFSLQPATRLAWQPSRCLSVRYGVGLSTKPPLLAALSDVAQEIQTGMVRRGNASLKPFHILDQQLTADYNARLIGVSLSLGYRHEYRPIMETVLYESGLFVRTYENQRSFRRLSAEATVTLRPWREHLTLSVTPLIYRYVSHGNAYRHTHTIKRLKVDADLTWGPWMLSYNTFMGPANDMYGEESVEERNMNSLLVGYKRRRWTVKAGLFNAFVREYWMETRNGNALTPFTSRAHCDRNTYLAVKLTVSLDYGRQMREQDRKIRNEDRDAGIMRGTK